MSDKPAVDYDEKSSFSQIEDMIGLHDGELEQAIKDNRPRLHGRTLTYALAFVGGTGFTLFGYVCCPYNR